MRDSRIVERKKTGFKKARKKISIFQKIVIMLFTYREYPFTLYIDSNNLLCDFIKILLLEKKIPVDIVLRQSLMEGISSINPYNSVPTLMTKELVIYETHLIFEYVEEKFPYPPLFPMVPIKRAQARAIFKKIALEWAVTLLNLQITSSLTLREKLIIYLVDLDKLLGKTSFLLDSKYFAPDLLLASFFFYLLPQNLKIRRSLLSRLYKYITKLFKIPSVKFVFNL